MVNKREAMSGKKNLETKKDILNKTIGSINSPFLTKPNSDLYIKAIE